MSQLLNRLKAIYGRRQKEEQEKGESMKQKTKIVLADDHPLVRQGVRDYLSQSSDFSVVAEVSRGADLEAVVREHRPDLLLLDLSMEAGFDPAETVIRLREIQPSLKVLVLSAHDETTWALRMLEAKADGYIIKTESPHLLNEAVRAVMAGGPWFSQRLMQSLASGYWHSQALEPHERRLLQGLADGKTLRDIASETLMVSERSAYDYLSNAMEKLRAHSRAEAVAKAMRQKVIE